MSAEAERPLTHEEIVWDLAQTLQTCYVNVPLGSVYLADAASRATRVQQIVAGKKVSSVSRVPVADVVSVRPSYSRFCLHIYEVKASRADLFADLRAEKWRAYLAHCHRLTFAMPARIAKEEEVPAEAGYMVRGPKGWQVQRAAPARDADIPHETLLSMLFLKERMTRRERQIGKLVNLRYTGNRWDIAREFGETLAQAWADRVDSRNKKAEFERLIKQVEEGIREGLGFDSKWPAWDLAELVKSIREKGEAAQ